MATNGSNGLNGASTCNYIRWDVEDVEKIIPNEKEDI
jgi:hypothetical protein